MNYLQERYIRALYDAWHDSFLVLKQVSSERGQKRCLVNVQELGVERCLCSYCTIREFFPKPQGRRTCYFHESLSFGRARSYLVKSQYAH